MCFFFFFNDTATTEIYTLSLHDALPIWSKGGCGAPRLGRCCAASARDLLSFGDRKSTRLNSSHGYISYAVFCLKKKKSRARVPVQVDTASVQCEPPSSVVREGQHRPLLA